MNIFTLSLRLFDIIYVKTCSSSVSRDCSTFLLQAYIAGSKDKEAHSSQNFRSISISTKTNSCNHVSFIIFLYLSSNNSLQ